MAEQPDDDRRTPGADPAYGRAVSSWAAHLVAGGTTDWATWRAVPEGHAPDLGHPATRLPDAPHLALLHRLNLAGEAVPELAARVLATPAPGRGLVDVPLTWPSARGPAPHRFGTPALDPDAVPAEEMVRLAVGVLAHLLAEVPVAEVPPAPAPWPAPWRRRFRVHGSPATAAAVRAGLLEQHLVETDWRPAHIVVARPVEVMMAEHWAATVRAGGILKWSTLWRRTRAAGRLPGPIDVPGLAARLAERGPAGGTVHVVVARDAEQATRLAADVVGADPGRVPPGVDLAVCDLLRRVNRLTALTAGPERVRSLAGVLLDTVLIEPQLVDPVLADARVPGGPREPVVPPRARAWADEVAAGAAADLRRAGYAVHGDPDDLAPACPTGTVDRERTLALALTAVRRTWHLRGAP